MSATYISQFYYGLVEFCDTFALYFMQIGSFNSSEFRSFLFDHNFIIQFTNNFGETISIAGFRRLVDIMLLYIESIGIIGDLVSNLIDLGLSVVNFMYNLIFVPIFIPSGFTVDTVPFIYTFMSGVVVITFVSGVFTAVLKPLKSLITFN